MPYSNSDCQPTDCSKGRRELAEIAARDAQADAHVRAFRSFESAYGNREGYHLAMARKARSDAQLMETPRGRAFIASRNADHATWRASR